MSRSRNDTLSGLVASATTRPKLVAALFTVVAVFTGVSSAVVAAKPKVDAPTIVAKPVPLTTLTTATFAFTDSPASLSFECQLNGGLFAACASPKTYTGPLAEASHTFNVRAVNNQNTRSDNSTYSWIVDRTPPPAPTLASTPTDPTNAITAVFSFVDADNGASFLCQLDGAVFAACVSPQTYTWPLAAGPHTFTVKARDLAGLVGTPTNYLWRVDLSSPPAPVITSFPEEPTADTAATFAFSDSELGVNLHCKLDNGPFSPCTSPRAYSGLSVAMHTFQVRALDPAGNASSTVGYTWVVQAHVTGFTVSASVSQALYPGAAAAVNVSITNPFAFPIRVSQLAVTVVGATASHGQPNPVCNGQENLLISGYRGPSPLIVAAGATVTLAELGVPTGQWPQLQMPDLPVNQDACKDTVFTLDYIASATRATP